MFNKFNEKDNNLILNIVKTRNELNINISNFQYADQKQVDYFLYQIKANQAKLDYLLSIAKENNITIDNVNKIKFNA